MIGKSFKWRSGARLAANAARPEAKTAEVRRKLRRLSPSADCPSFSWELEVGIGISVRSFRSDRHRMEEMRAGCGFAGRDFGTVWVVAVHANLALDRAGGPVPIPAGPAVGSGFPVAIGRPVATAAKERALRQLNLPPVAGLQQFQVLLVVAVETVVVPVVRPVPHHNVRVFLRDDEIVLRVEPQGWGLALFMAGVAIKVRQIGLGANQFGVGLPDGSGFEELGIDQRDIAGRRKTRARTRHELQGQGRSEE